MKIRTQDAQLRWQVVVLFSDEVLPIFLHTHKVVHLRVSVRIPSNLHINMIHIYVYKRIYRCLLGLQHGCTSVTQCQKGIDGTCGYVSV